MNNSVMECVDSLVIGAGHLGDRFSADRSWLLRNALTASGEPDQVKGVATMPGLYFLGLRWIHRRSSHTIDGVGRDAEFGAGRRGARVADGERMAA